LIDIKVDGLGGFSAITFTIEGHANYAKKGNDIVCSGVSTLVHTMVESLHEMVNVGKIIEDSDEKFVFVISYNEISKNHDNITTGTIIATIVRTTIIGLKDISRAYPEHAKFESRGIL
jgi:uncharacterized protein